MFVVLKAIFSGFVVGSEGKNASFYGFYRFFARFLRCFGLRMIVFAIGINSAGTSMKWLQQAIL